MPKTLTPKQRQFVQFVAMGKGYTDAARAAGYPETPYIHNTASQLAHAPHIARAISLTRERLNLTTEFTVDWWRKELSDCIKLATNSQDLDNRLKALDMAAKHLGIYTNTQTDAKLVTDVLATLALAGARTRVLTEGKVVESEAAELPAVPDAPLDARAAQDE